MKKDQPRLQADLLLLCVAVIWGSAFVVQRIAGQHMGFFAFNGFRFILGALILAPIAFRKWKFPGQIVIHDRRSLRRKFGLALLAGVALFLASALQQAGLEQTTAGTAGFFTSLYVVIVPFMLSLIWRQQIRWITWLAGAMAVLGAGLLSTGGVGLVLAPGDSLELLGAFIWALHVILIGIAVRQFDVLRFSVAQYTVAGLLNLAAVGLFVGDLFSGIGDAWWTILFIGLISTALGYTLQAKAQQHAPPSDAAILLSLEAVFAALFGWLVLAERLDPIQWVGCILILSGVILAQWRQYPDTIPG